MEKIDYNVAVLEGKAMLVQIIMRTIIVIFHQKIYMLISTQKDFPLLDLKQWCYNMIVKQPQISVCMMKTNEAMSKVWYMYYIYLGCHVH